MNEQAFNSLLQQNIYLGRRIELLESALVRAGLVDKVDIPDFPPIADPAPFDSVKFAEFLKQNWRWWTDPAPEDILNISIRDLATKIGGGVTDPAPEDIVNINLGDLIGQLPGGGVTDPPPADIARFTRTDIEARLHKISSEMVRLKSLHKMLEARLDEGD